MNYLLKVVAAASMLLVGFTGCGTINEQLGLADTSKPLVYDTSVPLEQTSTLSQFMSVTIRKFNGNSVSWNRPVIIPAGEHDFVVDYKWDKPHPFRSNVVERQTSSGITVRYKFKPGHKYTMAAQTDDSRRTVSIVLKDETEIAKEREMDNARVEAEFKASLPKETTKPTRFEGTWKVPKDWGTFFSYMSFKGNTWEYSPGSNSSDGERGLFIINGDTFKLFRQFTQGNDGEWRPDNDYRNAVSEYRFVFEADGGFRLITIKGFGKKGTFYKQ